MSKVCLLFLRILYQQWLIVLQFSLRYFRKGRGNGFKKGDKCELIERRSLIRNVQVSLAAVFAIDLWKRMKRMMQKMWKGKGTGNEQ